MIERLFGPSWKTTLSGYVLVICGSTGLTDEISPFLPERIRYGLHGLCLLAMAFGLLSAKDANVTHTPALAATEPKAIKP